MRWKTWLSLTVVPAVSSPRTSSQVSSSASVPTQWLLPPVDMAIHTSFLQMPWAATVQLLFSATVRVQCLLILHTFRFTRHVSPLTVTSSLSSPLCLSLCVTTVVFGCPRRLRTPRLCRQVQRREAIFPRKTATITWSVVIPHSVTSFPATLPHVQPRSVATRALVLTTLVWLCSSTSLSLSSVSVLTLFAFLEMVNHKMDNH